MKQRVDAHYAILAAEFTGLTATEVLLLQGAAKLLVRAEIAQRKDADISIRALGAVRRLLAGLHRQRLMPPAPPSSPSPTSPWSPMRERSGLLPTKESAEP
jgi:hypothetical protein